MATAPRPSPHTLPDRALRDTLRHPPHVRALLRRAVPAMADDFDTGRLRVLDREFPLDDWRGREADLLYEIPFRQGRTAAPALVCVVLEHQSDPDPLMPLRTLLDATLYWERQWQDHQRRARPRPPLELRPVLPIVFYTGSKGWRTVRSLRGLLAEPAAVHRFVPDWTPVFWNLTDDAPDDLLASGDAWLQALAVVRAEAADRAEFERLFGASVRGLNHSAADEVQWHQLMRLVLMWAARRTPQEQQALWEAAERAAVSPRRRREVRVMAKTAAEAWMEEGEVQGLRKSLIIVAEQSLGKPRRSHRAKLLAITDVARLTRMLAATSRVQSWSELLTIE